MDPITLIVTALVQGAAKAATDVVPDAYKGMRELLRKRFAGKPAAIQESAFRNSSLQGGYLIIAARALGLDCGPMSGFDAAKLDAAFWAGTSVKTNFICTLGQGDPAKLFARNPRLSFEEACQLV